MSGKEVVFVCHDVGGTGGMERHAERLIEQLLDAGRPVTVLARTCRMPAREGLRFHRVPTPPRPFTIAYPAFFAVATALLARRRDAVVHTTGAIVANRADVSTVHYCHRAAAGRMEGARTSRDGILHRVNAAIAAPAGRAAERWCYRPQRTRVLCAVSGGVAAELRDGFPAMAGAIRSIPNGVDADMFAPDAEARRATRSELGLGVDTPVALFVGGDWQRKGLRFAVEALADAPRWHLVVAGSGDREPLLTRARSQQTAARVHFLGPVNDMPRLYAMADAFVLPTAYETFSLVSYEAAASGLPLLVTRVSGVEDVLQDGRNGWFIGPDAADIARRLQQLSADPELAQTMGQRAREAVLPYSWKAMAQGYLALYSELADRA